MSALRTALRPALTPALGSARRGVSRYFTTFNQVAQSYVETSDTAATSGNVIFIEATFATTETGQSNLIGLHSSSATQAIGLRLDFGFLKFYSEGFTPGAGSTDLRDGKLHRASVTVNKVTGAFTVHLDGAVEYTGTHSNVNQIANDYRVSLGARVRSIGGAVDSFYVGLLADAVVKNDSTHSLNMPINRYYTPQNNIVLDESGNGNNGTFVNIAAGRSKYYQQRADGNFVDLQGNVLEVAYKVEDRTYFTTFDQVAQGYIALSSQIPLVGQYEIECDFYVPNNTVERTLFGNRDNTAYLSLRADGAIRFRGNNGVVEQTGINTYQGGILNRVLVKKTATNIIIILNGVTIFDDTSSTDFVFEYIGRYSASAFFLDGIAANFKAWNGGDRLSGSLVLDMPIDANYTPTNNTVINKATGNNGAFVNVADGDSAFYELINNNWVDENGNAIEVAY